MRTIWWIATVAGSAVVAAAVIGRGRSAPSAAPPLPLPRYRGGDGPPLLLLHGVGGNWRSWSPVIPLLEQHHDVLAPTLLGHGGADALAADVAPSLDALVDGVEVELDRAGIDRAHIVGNSLGGWVAIELARRGRARSMVLFSPGGARTSQFRIAAVALGLRLSIGALARLAAYADRIADSRRLRHAIVGLQVAHPERVDPEALAADIRASAHAPVVGPLLRSLPRLQLEPLPHDPDRPVRVVWADPDRVIPFAYFGAPMMTLLPGAELIHRQGIGHVPMTDDPAGVTQLILEVTAAADRGSRGA